MKLLGIASLGFYALIFVTANTRVSCTEISESDIDISSWVNESYWDNENHRIKLPESVWNTCIDELRENSVCLMPSIIKKETVYDFLNEAFMAKLTLNQPTYNIFIADNDTNYAWDHIRNKHLYHSYHTINQDGMVPIKYSKYNKTMNKLLAEWPPFLQLFNNILLEVYKENPIQLHLSHDIHGSYSTIYLHNDINDYHFDQHPFSAILTLNQEPNTVSFEYYPPKYVFPKEYQTKYPHQYQYKCDTNNNINTINNIDNNNVVFNFTDLFECAFENLDRMIDNDYDIQPMQLFSTIGDIYFFHGNNSLHRSSKWSGSNPRIIHDWGFVTNTNFRHTNYFVEKWNE